jgi:molybdopterin-guanine dinucleotide biosynthesis protein MobB
MGNREKKKDAKLVDRLRRLPVLGVCGFSGSGKTTLIEAVIPRLLKRNLKIAVVKHDVHGIDVDRPGKDSDRFFQAGADVFLQGNESLIRLHTDSEQDLFLQLTGLAAYYDLILLEGHKQSPLAKVWVLNEEEDNPPPAVTDIQAVLPRTVDRLEVFTSFLITWLDEQWSKTPVIGCVQGFRWNEAEGQNMWQSGAQSVEKLRHAAARLKNVTRDIVFLGIPPISELRDDGIFLSATPDAGGSCNGIAAAMRWHPFASWLIVNGQPGSLDILDNLLAARKPGIWAAVLRRESVADNHTFSALLDFRCLSILERCDSDSAIWDQLLSHPKTILL